ncbi:MAG TPA: NUDIX domain-containing protein [Planctomycetota bacterium]|nr:NUDIX domain-containing protein [Planctomycetota bacterium]
MHKPYRLAVKAAILDAEGRCLLIRRSTHCRHYVGQWEWPGGKADKGEEFTEALAREAREETSLEIEITGLVGAAHFEMPAVHVILLCMEARSVGGEVALSEEHDQFAWAPLSDLASWDLTEQVRPLMLDYARSRRTTR